MSNSLIRSNRDRSIDQLIKPKKTATPEGIEKRSKKVVDSVTFDTNLKISNHTRNKLLALSNLGYSKNQKEAVDLVLDNFIDSVTDEERQEILLQIKIFERKDAKMKK